MLDRTVHIVFATNFSDACHAAIPAVARWVDQLGCRLTILHVYDSRRVLYRDAMSRLESFFAEADNYPNCDRLLLDGDPAESIARYCENMRETLLLLPPSDQSGLPRPWHRSLRAKLMQRLSIPIWTLGRTLVGEPIPAGAKHIAAFVNNPEEGTSHIRYGARYAAATDSTLHLIHVIPQVDEGSLTHPLRTAAPLGEEYAEAWMEEILASLEYAAKIELHLEQGSVRRLLPQLFERTGADMLLVSRQSACEPQLLRGPIVNPIFRQLSAGIVSIPLLPEIAPATKVAELRPGFVRAS
jgi:nucleotide-binding universal stress UspA family protein